MEHGYWQRSPTFISIKYFFNKNGKNCKKKKKKSHIDEQINTEAQMACYNLSRWMSFVYL